MKQCHPWLRQGVAGKKGQILGSSDMRPDAMAPLDASVTAGEVSASSNAATNPEKKSRSRKGLQRISRAPKSDQNVGNVLRSVYQTAMQEEIPAEMLDLLSKLD